MLGFFKKFKEGLAKTVGAISERTHGLFGGRKIDAASLEELEEALYTADFGVETTTEIMAEINQAYRQDKTLQGRQAAQIGAAVLRRVLAGSEGRLGGEAGPPGTVGQTVGLAPGHPPSAMLRRTERPGLEPVASSSVGHPPKPNPPHALGAKPVSIPPQSTGGAGQAALNSKPTVIILIGVNGSGKTTTCAKLGWRLKQDGATVTLAAADTFRAAAIEQLQAWADRLGLELVASHTGADSAAVAFDAWTAAKARGRDYLVIDTAGRLHTKSNLMAELAKIRRVLEKNDPAAPHHRWLVVDGSHGANSIEQARVFHQSFGLTGLIVTKLDGTSRGGAVVGIYRQLKLPIYFVGLGEQAEDLQPFEIENYVNAIFGLEAGK